MERYRLARGTQCAGDAAIAAGPVRPGEFEGKIR